MVLLEVNVSACMCLRLDTWRLLMINKAILNTDEVINRLKKDKHPYSARYLEILQACLDRNDSLMVRCAISEALKHLREIQ